MQKDTGRYKISLENKLTTWYRLRSLRESVLCSMGTIFNRAKVVMEPVLMVFQGFLMYKHTQALVSAINYTI